MNGVGFGGEKLPDLNQTFSFFGSVWYYPNVKGTATQRRTQSPITGFRTNLAPYNILKYQAGLTYALRH